MLVHAFTSNYARTLRSERPTYFLAHAISLCTPKKVCIEANDGWLFALHISSERTVRVCVTPPYNSFLDLVHPLRVFLSLSSASLISFGRLSIIILEEFWVPYDEHKDGTDSVVRGPLIFSLLPKCCMTPSTINAHQWCSLEKLDAAMTGIIASSYGPSLCSGWLDMHAGLSLHTSESRLAHLKRTLHIPCSWLHNVIKRLLVQLHGPTVSALKYKHFT